MSGIGDLAQQTSTVKERGEGSSAADRGASLARAFDCERPLDLPELRTFGSDVDTVYLGRAGIGGEAGHASGDASRSLRIDVLDRWMSGTHAVLRRVVGVWLVEDQGSTNGTFVNGRQVRQAELCDGDVLELGHTFFVYRAKALRGLLAPASPELETLRADFAERLGTLARVAQSPLTVVIRGETGSGKEVVARALHSLSGRSGAFVAINCAALPESLFASDMFGFRKGAFTGAYEDRPGLIRSADAGTLFLDEIGDLSLPAQAALLRVLEESEVLPVGATRPVAVDLRAVAATHRDLEAMVGGNQFRADLFARLSGMVLPLLPLRERREDLGLLIRALLTKKADPAAQDVSFSLPAARALFAHRWPLNVRELEKALTFALAISAGGRIELQHLPPSVTTAVVPMAVGLLSTAPPVAPPAPARPRRRLTPEEVAQRDSLIELLRQHEGNVTAVARVLGKARMQVQRWLRRFEIDASAYRK